MKKIYIALLLSSPLAVMAQPILQNSRDFKVGMYTKYIDCEPVAPGTSGANQTWDFTGINIISGNDTIVTNYVTPPAGNPFPSATVCEKASDKTYTFLSRTTTENNTVGVLDSSGQYDIKITYTNPMKTGQRPVMYQSSYTDNFTETITASGLNGTGAGSLTATVDGYGTLKLPNGTFNDVLRVRVVANQSDTIPFVGELHTKIISYYWFDNKHVAPLLMVDSFNQITPFGNESEQTAQFLAKEHDPVSVETMNAQRVKFTGAFAANTIVLNGTFDAAKSYEVKLYNLQSQVVYNTNFKGGATNQKFALNSDFASGIYLLSVMETGNTANSYAIKLVK